MRTYGTRIARSTGDGAIDSRFDRRHGAANCPHPPGRAARLRRQSTKSSTSGWCRLAGGEYGSRRSVPSLTMVISPPFSDDTWIEPFTAEDAHRVARLDGGVRDTVTVAQGPARERHRRDGRVLHFAIEDDVRCQACRLANRPEEREQQLEAMAAEVEHRSAAGDRALDEPVAFLVRLRVETLERIDLGDDRVCRSLPLRSTSRMRWTIG